MDPIQPISKPAPGGPRPGGTSPVRVKICGLTSAAGVGAAAEAGAAYAGFVFFPPSPRSLTPAEARPLLATVPEGICRVALTVDAEDMLIEEVAALHVDMLQLHGAEPPERVAALRRRTGLRVMKAIGVRGAEDLIEIPRYVDVADQLLIDAKPPVGANRPGGNALAFDWRLIAGRDWPLPWMLAGGLAPGNVAEAVRLTGATQLDVSSGVETAPGVKDPERIRAFIAAAG